MQPKNALPACLFGIIGRIALRICAAALLLPPATVARVQESMPARPAPISRHHWHKYVNHKHGFSFWYPDPYKPVSVPPDAGEKARPHEKRLLVLERRDDPDAEIWVILDTRPFDLGTMSHSHSPTGWDPDWIPAGKCVGHHTFYFYGAGGGGVEYPDQYFVKLKGKTLEFEFDGPYKEGKSPVGETRELEPKILEAIS